MASPSPTSPSDSKVDESLYSRQLYAISYHTLHTIPSPPPVLFPNIKMEWYHRYVFGHDAQLKMGATNVLLVGVNGLGVEIGTHHPLTSLYMDVNYALM
jgi:molybdopterin/thiamine biosynthesis adenylyltransferase